jgi:hypothetical protein
MLGSDRGLSLPAAEPPECDPVQPQMSVKGAAGGRQGRPGAPLRNLDLSDSDCCEAYAKVIADVPPGWKCTERLMKTAARQHLRPSQPASEHWYSDKVAQQLEQ